MLSLIAKGTGASRYKRGLELSKPIRENSVLHMESMSQGEGYQL